MYYLNKSNLKLFVCCRRQSLHTLPLQVHLQDPRNVSVCAVIGKKSS
uniref:Uncharacterized protein n=2 Tax=Arundo donax TaxID=35708 RepID=A0A0A9GTP8_ARUDO